jgi:hypothetical protein
MTFANFQRKSLQQLVPEHLRHSPLLGKGGFDIFEGLLDDRFLRSLLSEAMDQSAVAKESKVSTPDTEEIRGGIPPRRFLSAPGGSVQDAFYRAAWVHGFLGRVAGTPVSLSGSLGTFTYYARDGDYLALHRDVEICDLAVITCLMDSGQGLGGELQLYPGRIFEPLSAIRRTPQHGVVTVRLLPGQTIVLLGGIVPHSLTPVAANQVRIVSILCYRL